MDLRGIYVTGVCKDFTRLDLKFHEGRDQYFLFSLLYPECKKTYGMLYVVNKHLLAK